MYADFGKNPHGIQGGIRPGIIISCDASNHDGAPQVSVVPLSSKLKDIPVHVILNPKDVSGFGLSKISDFMPEDAQTISKGCIRAKSGTVIEDSGVREEIDRALIRQFDLLPVARQNGNGGVSKWTAELKRLIIKDLSDIQKEQRCIQ